MRFLIDGGRGTARGAAMIVLVTLLAPLPARPLAASMAAQVPDTAAKSAPRSGKRSTAKKVATALADTLATVGAAMVVDTLLGDAGKAIGQMLGGAAGDPCGQAAATPPTTAGAKLLNIAKKAAADSTSSPSATPCPQPAVDASAMSGPVPGGPASVANAAMMATPLGMAVTAAPLAAAGVGAAAKGVKKLLGGGPMTATGMLKQVQEKGRLVLRGVHFVAHTEVFDEGYEAALSTLAEALTLVPGPFALHVELEADKGEEPDSTLAAKRVAKVWATLVAAGVPSSVFVDGVIAPDSLVAGRKPAKPGSAAVELWKIEARP